MAEFNIKELLIRATLDYIGPAFPLWWEKNQSRYKLPDLMGINTKQLLGAKYFMTLTLSYPEKEISRFGSTVVSESRTRKVTLPNEPIVSIGIISCLLIFNQTTTVRTIIPNRDKISCLLIFNQTTTLLLRETSSSSISCLLIFNQTTTSSLLCSRKLKISCLLIFNQTTTVSL